MIIIANKCCNNCRKYGNKTVYKPKQKQGKHSNNS